MPLVRHTPTCLPIPPTKRAFFAERNLLSIISSPDTSSYLALRRDWCWRHGSDLFDQELALINELLVICSVLQEMRQEVEQFLAVHEQDLLDGDGFVRVGNKDLEYVEPLVLDHLSIVSQEVHTDLQVLASVDIRCHDIIVRAVEEDLAQELDRLSLCDVAL